MRYRSLAALAAILAAVYDQRRGSACLLAKAFSAGRCLSCGYATIILASSAGALDPPPLLTI
jgi:hypothetical protein